MNNEDIQVLAHAVRYGGGPYADKAAEGVERAYNVELSDEMGRLVDKLYNLPREDDASAAISVLQSLIRLEPDSMDEATQFVDTLNQMTYTVNRNADRTPIEKGAPASMRDRFLGEVAGAANDVYVTSGAMNPDKVLVAHDLHENNFIVMVENRKKVQELKNLFGWEELDSISLAPGALNGMGVSDETREEILGRSGTMTDWIRTMKYHIGRML